MARVLVLNKGTRINQMNLAYIPDMILVQKGMRLAIMRKVLPATTGVPQTVLRVTAVAVALQMLYLRPRLF